MAAKLFSKPTYFLFKNDTLKALSAHVSIRYQCLYSYKLIIYNCGNSTKVTCSNKIIRIKLEKVPYHPHYLSAKVFKVTVRRVT